MLRLDTRSLGTIVLNAAVVVVCDDVGPASLDPKLAVRPHVCVPESGIMGSSDSPGVAWGAGTLPDGGQRRQSRIGPVKTDSNAVYWLPDGHFDLLPLPSSVMSSIGARRTAAMDVTGTVQQRKNEHRQRHAMQVGDDHVSCRPGGIDGDSSMDDEEDIDGAAAESRPLLIWENVMSLSGPTGGQASRESRSCWHLCREELRDGALAALENGSRSSTRQTRQRLDIILGSHGPSGMFDPLMLQFGLASWTGRNYVTSSSPSTMATPVREGQDGGGASDECQDRVDIDEFDVSLSHLDAWENADALLVQGPLSRSSIMLVTHPRGGQRDRGSDIGDVAGALEGQNAGRSRRSNVGELLTGASATVSPHASPYSQTSPTSAFGLDEGAVLARAWEMELRNLILPDDGDATTCSVFMSHLRKEFDHVACSRSEGCNGRAHRFKLIRRLRAGADTTGLCSPVFQTWWNWIADAISERAIEVHSLRREMMSFETFDGQLGMDVQRLAEVGPLSLEQGDLGADRENTDRASRARTAESTEVDETTVVWLGWADIIACTRLHARSQRLRYMATQRLADIALNDAGEAAAGEADASGSKQSPKSTAWGAHKMRAFGRRKVQTARAKIAKAKLPVSLRERRTSAMKAMAKRDSLDNAASSFDDEAEDDVQERPPLTQFLPPWARFMEMSVERRWSRLDALRGLYLNLCPHRPTAGDPHPRQSHHQNTPSLANTIATAEVSGSGVRGARKLLEDARAKGIAVHRYRESGLVLREDTIDTSELRALLLQLVKDADTDAEPDTGNAGCGDGSTRMRRLIARRCVEYEPLQRLFAHYDKVGQGRLHWGEWCALGMGAIFKADLLDEMSAGCCDRNVHTKSAFRRGGSSTLASSVATNATTLVFGSDGACAACENANYRRDLQGYSETRIDSEGGAPVVRAARAVQEATKVIAASREPVVVTKRGVLAATRMLKRKHQAARAARIARDSLPSASAAAARVGEVQLSENSTLPERRGLAAGVIQSFWRAMRITMITAVPEVEEAYSTVVLGDVSAAGTGRSANIGRGSTAAATAAEALETTAEAAEAEEATRWRPARRGRVPKKRIPNSTKSRSKKAQRAPTVVRSWGSQDRPELSQRVKTRPKRGGRTAASTNARSLTHETVASFSSSSSASLLGAALGVGVDVDLDVDFDLDLNLDLDLDLGDRSATDPCERLVAQAEREVAALEAHLARLDPALQMASANAGANRKVMRRSKSSGTHGRRHGSNNRSQRASGGGGRRRRSASRDRLSNNSSRFPNTSGMGDNSTHASAPILGTTAGWGGESKTRYALGDLDNVASNGRAKDAVKHGAGGAAVPPEQALLRRAEEELAALERQLLGNL